VTHHQISLWLSEALSSRGKANQILVLASAKEPSDYILFPKYYFYFCCSVLRDCNPWSARWGHNRYTIWSRNPFIPTDQLCERNWNISRKTFSPGLWLIDQFGKMILKSPRGEGRTRRVLKAQKGKVRKCITVALILHIRRHVFKIHTIQEQSISLYHVIPRFRCELLRNIPQPQTRSRTVWTCHLFFLLLSCIKGHLTFLRIKNEG
jgi:hypothetical protein